MKKVNFLDLLAALVTYSNIYWERKVRILFKLFDFDRNKVISVDEAIAMVVSWIRGICKMIGMVVPLRNDLENLSN